MMNYNKTFTINQGREPTTWVYFQIPQGSGVEWYDIKLPYPNYLLHTNQGYSVGWLIKGSESKYTEELRARFIQTFLEYAPRVIESKPKATSQAHTSPTIHELKEFNVLDSLKTKAHNISSYQSLLSNDEIFWHLKFYCEHLIKRDCIPSYQDLERLAYNQYPNKCKSTLRAKARSIYYWYEERDFKCGRASKKYKNMREYQELNMATRQEQAKIMHTKLAEETKRKVLNVVTGMFSEDYKKKNGNWNVSKIAKDSKTSRNTVMKYLKKLKNG